MKKNITNRKNVQTSAALVPVGQDTAAPLPVLAKNPIAPFSSYIAELSLERIIPNPNNPRTEMADEGIKELAESIRKLNVESPILVMPVEDGKYQIVYGERRFRASQLAGKTTIPAKVEHMTAEQAEIRAIHENIQRENMTPFDEGRAFENLHKNRGMAITEICATFARTKAYIENRMNLTKLIPPIAKMLRNKEITLEIAQVLAKYDAKIQKSTYDDHFKSDGWSSWRGITAKELDKRLFNTHLTKLNAYQFDKSECKTCANNTSNNVLFEECSDCSACRNPKCLQKKNTDYLVERAITMATEDPYLNLVFIREETSKEVVENLTKKGHEVKMLEVHIRSLDSVESPATPDLSRVEDEDDRNIRQQRYEKQIERFKAECAKQDLAVIKGQKIKYGVIRNKSIEIFYQTVKREPTPSNDGSVASVNETTLEKVIQKDQRKKEIRYENTVRDLKKEIGHTVKNFKNKAALTPMESQAFNYILLLRVSSSINMELLGLKNAEYDEEKCLKYAAKLTEKQKNLLYRMFIANYLSNISEIKCTPDNPDVKLMLDFMDLHNPERYAEIDQKYKKTYENQHRTLLKRMEDLAREKELLRLQELERKLQEHGVAVDMETGEVLTLPAAQAPNLLPESTAATDAVEEAEVLTAIVDYILNVREEETVPFSAEVDPDYIEREMEEPLPEPAEIDPDFIEWEVSDPFDHSLSLQVETTDMPLAA